MVSRHGKGVRTIATRSDAILNGTVEVRVPVEVEARIARSWGDRS
jgi:hypothetical protein